MPSHSKSGAHPGQGACDRCKKNIDLAVSKGVFGYMVDTRKGKIIAQFCSSCGKDLIDETRPPWLRLTFAVPEGHKG